MTYVKGFTALTGVCVRFFSWISSTQFNISTHEKVQIKIKGF